ncbi:MAG: Clp protease N-terminal domain-containing protein [Acidimicrobiales bacterium]
MTADPKQQARDLWRGVVAGEPEAIERVCRSHPKYAGRPSDRLDPSTITLRDAQEAVGREHGFAGWKEVVDTPRWDPRTQLAQDFRTMDFARAAGSRHAHVEHILDGLASPREPTVAARVLAAVGYERRPTGDGEAATETSSTPAQQAVVAFAAGLALGMGAPGVTPEHLLLALAYTEIGIDLLRRHNVDPDDVVAGLADAGVATPGVAPPVPRLPWGPRGPRVYFRGSGKGIAPELHRRYPPGTVMTGFNISAWKPGWGWVDAEDEVPLEEIVRSVILDPADVEVVPVWEAAEAERRALRAE